MSDILKDYEVRERAIALYNGSVKQLYKRLTQIAKKEDFVGDEITILDNHMHLVVYHASLLRSNGIILFDIPFELKELIKDKITKDEFKNINDKELINIINEIGDDKSKRVLAEICASLHYLYRAKHYLFGACLVQSMLLVGK